MGRIAVERVCFYINIEIVDQAGQPFVNPIEMGVTDNAAVVQRVREDPAYVAAFKNLYSFLGQIVPFHDPDLEKLYTYGRMLLRKLPRPEGGAHWDPDETYRIVGEHIEKALNDFIHLSSDEIVTRRYHKYREMGVYRTK